MSILDLQIALLRERLAEVVTAKRNARQFHVDARKLHRRLRYDWWARRAFALRVTRRLSFDALGKVLGVGAVNARSWFTKGNRVHSQRKSVPAFHSLEGENWEAYNCRSDWNSWYQCKRPDRHPHIVSRVYDGAVIL